MALVKAPSNIAIIKYMGKDDLESNLPANASLSLTLDGLCTWAEVSASADAPAGQSRWEGGMPRGIPAASAAVPPTGGAGALARAQAPRVPDLSEAGVARFLRHVERVRGRLAEAFGPAGLEAEASRGLAVRAANTFPAASGIASSASAFAAVTLGTAAALARDPAAFRRAYDASPELRRALARLSREGSGSSCRSFEGPWVLWERESAASLEAQLPELVDIVILIGQAPKAVSSSEAHRLVRTSPLFDGRTDRVASRIRSLEAALGEGDLPMVSRIAWAELWEMHSLFHTCAEPFTYWEPGTLQALQWLKPRMGAPGAPIVTMDAGPNLHVLVPAAEAAGWVRAIEQALPFELLIDRQGRGASVVA